MKKSDRKKAKVYTRIVVTKETFDMVICQCVAEYYNHNPHMKEVLVTQDFIVNRIAKHYLGLL